MFKLNPQSYINQCEYDDYDPGRVVFFFKEPLVSDNQSPHIESDKTFISPDASGTPESAVITISHIDIANSPLVLAAPTVLHSQVQPNDKPNVGSDFQFNNQSNDRNSFTLPGVFKTTESAIKIGGLVLLDKKNLAVAGGSDFAERLASRGDPIFFISFQGLACFHVPSYEVVFAFLFITIASTSINYNLWHAFKGSTIFFWHCHTLDVNSSITTTVAYNHHAAVLITSCIYDQDTTAWVERAELN